MRLAVQTIAYRESEYIGACILNWAGVVDKHLVLVSETPWNGDALPDDGTIEIASKFGATVEVGNWKTEAEQRSHALERLRDYDYVLIVDPDELYTKLSITRIVDALNRKETDAYKCESLITYFKTLDWVYYPPDEYKPVIAINPKDVTCYEHRHFNYVSTGNLVGHFNTIQGVVCHHASFAKQDDKVAEKVKSFSHSDIVGKNWYTEVWDKWKPGSDALIRPYGNERSKAINRPAPTEIKGLVEKSQRMKVRLGVNNGH